MYFWAFDRDEVARTLQKQQQKEGVDVLQEGILPSLPNAVVKGTPKAASAHLQGILIGKAWKEHAAGKNFRVSKPAYGIASLRYQPISWGAWESVFALLVKTSHSPAGIK